ncbi:MAG: OmpH family outer membrane protein [Opitutae bacterium]|nr:OmpH family outer membrane protein [Opitutae bacterium]
MKNIVRSLLGLAAFSSAVLVAQAQPAPKIMVVDMAKLYDSHYKTEEQNAKLRNDEQKAQEELDKLNKEGNTLVEQYKELADQAQNAAASADAKQKAAAGAQAKLQEIQKKQNEVQSFQANTRNSLQQRINTFKTIMLEELTKLSSDVAKRKGATLLFDKSGPSFIGIPTIVYSDAGFDITDDVLKEINKDRPAAPVAAPTAPAAKPAASDAPAITVPGVTPKK